MIFIVILNTRLVDIFFELFQFGQQAPKLG